MLAYVIFLLYFCSGNRKVMFYQWIISLPMMVCFFWGIFFLIRCFRRSDEPLVNYQLLLFYIAATVLYFEHWIYFSGNAGIADERIYGIVNLCVYPIYYAYLRALTRVKANWEVLVLLIPPHIAIILYLLGDFTDHSS